MPSLSELTAASRTLAHVGLAKNTGKTVALTTLLGELAAQGRCVGVTSIGRDGEARDVLDERIAKPRIELPAGALVATTDVLLHASGVEHERVRETRLRTPLGTISIARIAAAGAVEVAGPTTVQDLHAVSEAMHELGAERVLLDGALDRRAAAAPAVADGVVVSTGTVLHRNPAEVARLTAEAVELLRLPLASGPAAPVATSALVRADGTRVPVPERLLLEGEPMAVRALLATAPDARELLVAGALCEPFLAAVLHAGRELTLVVADGTRVFLRHRSADWYRRQGVAIAARRAIALHAVTVNPLAPGSHRCDAHELRAAVAAALPDVPVLDVLAAAYVSVPSLSTARYAS